MNCPSCNAFIDDNDAKFCPECGTPLSGGNAAGAGTVVDSYMNVSQGSGGGFDNSAGGGFNNSYDNGGGSGFNNSYNNGGGSGFNNNYDNSGGNGFNNSFNNGGGAMPEKGLDANRSILMYYLLTIVTCGIYGLFFIYKMAQEMNIICAGDGKETPGLLKYFLLTIVTCGIYGIYWWYSVANRLQENAPRYGYNFSENGGNVLMWFIIGMFTCGLVALVGYNIIFNNMNILAAEYNRRNGYAS